MLALLRRSRLLSSLLLLASPAGAGTVLPVLHPCPVDTPWLEGSPARTGHAAHHAEAHGRSQTDRQEHTCNCIGSCLAGAVLAPASPVSVAAAPLARATLQGWTASDASLVLAPRASLLPRSTAPPQR
jgi:hypothetical protein